MDRNHISNFFILHQQVIKEIKYLDLYKNKNTIQDTLKYISKSKAILDYISKNQSGMTIRPLEAFFWEKVNY